MKKTFTAFISLFLCLSLIACSSKSKFEELYYYFESDDLLGAETHKLFPKEELNPLKYYLKHFLDGDADITVIDAYYDREPNHGDWSIFISFTVGSSDSVRYYKYGGFGYGGAWIDGYMINRNSMELAKERYESSISSKDKGKYNIASYFDDGTINNFRYDPKELTKIINNYK